MLVGGLAVAATAFLQVAPPTSETDATAWTDTASDVAETDGAFDPTGGVTLLDVETAQEEEEQEEVVEPTTGFATEGETMVTETAYPTTGAPSTTTGVSEPTTGALEPPPLFEVEGVRMGYDPTKQARVIEVDNQCSNPVYLHYGRTPPLRPQDVLWLNGKAQTTPYMIPGDVLWVYDDAGLFIGNAVVGSQTDTIVIGSSCAEVLTPGEP